MIVNYLSDRRRRNIIYRRLNCAAAWIKSVSLAASAMLWHRESIYTLDLSTSQIRSPTHRSGKRRKARAFLREAAA
jgi:hypothetical protein